jgi:adenylate cyclase
MTVACAACGAEHPAGRKFCTGCGAALVVACSACGAPAGPGERFCGECGKPLAGGPAPDALQGGGPDGECKWVSVLFADVAGSMTRAESLGPEQWATLMNRFFSAGADAVTQAGGTVDKFTGDGIMAVFGAPVAQEDHARRACLAALALVRVAGELELPLRVGIHSGEVVAGDVGAGRFGERTALGHAVGLAQRMENLADIGGVCLTERTAELVAGHFRLSDRGLHDVKGASRPVGVFALVGPQFRPAGTVRTATPLVGRQAELTVLEDALRRAEAGDAQVVGVVGEAGVGKSRLSEEFANACIAQGITVRRTAGLSHARDVPLLPVLLLLRDAFGVADTDGPAAAREKIAGRVVTLDPGLVDGLPVLFDFLEVPDPERPARLAPEARQRQVFAVLRRVTQRRSEREVLILMLEDLHWFDAASLAFLDELIPTFPGTRTLVLANFRPEFQAPWMAHSYYRQLSLAPLAPDAVDTLTGELVGRDPSLATLPAELRSRTGGNPFFLEEIVRSLVEDGTLAGEPGAYRLTRPLTEARVPGTVHAVLAARIDRLPAHDKETLQTASVIGRSFPVAVLERISGQAADVGRLCAAEFLQADGEDGYRFWHPLTQEVAYRSLLTPRRQALHAAVARALEGLDDERLDERAALIATHFAAAGDAWEAAQWEYRAGEWALRRDLGEATQRWRTVLDHLAAVDPGEASLTLELRTRIRLLRAATWSGVVLADREAIFAGGAALVERLSDQAEFPLLYVASGLERFTAGLVGDSLDAADMALRLAESHPRADTLAIAALFASDRAVYGGSATDALRFADLAVARAGDDPDLGSGFLGSSVLGRAWHARAEALAVVGRPAEARRELDRSVELLRRRRELQFLPFVLPCYVRLADLTGSDHAADTHAGEAVRIVQETGMLGIMLITALEAEALVALLAGRFDEAAQRCSLALAEARERRTGLFLEAALLAHLARARLGLGDVAGARVAAAEAIDVARRQGARVVEVYARLVGGRVTASASDLRAALAQAVELGASAYEPFCLEELARLDKDDTGLAGAAARFAAVGATGHARRLEAELA